jgi:hypothetical protein
MTSTASIRDYWKTTVLQHVTIRAITEAILDFEPTFESATEAGRLRWQAEINAIAVVVKKTMTSRRVNQTEEKFDVILRAYRRVKPDGSTHKAVITTLETLDTVAIAALGKTWGGLVDYWRASESAPVVEQISIDGAPAWVGSVTYQGIKIS